MSEVDLTCRHKNQEQPNSNRSTLGRDEPHRGACGGRPRKVMTTDVVRALCGHTSPERVGRLGLEPRTYGLKVRSSTN